MAKMLEVIKWLNGYMFIFTTIWLIQYLLILIILGPKSFVVFGKFYTREMVITAITAMVMVKYVR